MRYINIYIIKYISFIFCWIRLFKLKVVPKGSNDYGFYQKNKCNDFVYRKKTSELRFCSIFRNRYLNGFNTSICFISRLDFQKTKSYYFSTIKEPFNKPIFLLYQGGFAQVKIFSSLRKLPQAKSFPLSMTFSTSKYISSIKEVFYKPRFFLHQGSFPQENIFRLSRKLSTSQGFSFIK